jgi:phenylalanyl-tRNA synthetase beta chain
MKISLRLAQQFSNVDLNKIGTEELVRKIGSQLGEVDKVIEWGPKYEGIVVAKVVTCEKHPNADKLSLCTIDDGGVVKGVPRNKDGTVQVVCGAPNVRKGIVVAWLPPGVTVPSTFDKDPFILEAREIRGELSNGMLASPAELAISDNHEGILEIDAEEVGNYAKPGTPFKKLYGLDDVVIDVENKMFTHRPDLFGVLGDAREMAGIQGLAFKSPGWYLKTPKLEITSNDLPVSVDVKTKLVSRFMAISFQGIKVAPSPIWLQAYLTHVGIRPINNIVDISNYLMHITAQPTHAYDYDKLLKVSGSKQAKLEARQSKKGDKLKLLNGKELELQDDSTVLITSNDVPVGIGGVMGGEDTEVDENTTRIVLEVATFDMYNIRRTSMKYGLFTDAVTRFNKGQSPLQNDHVLAYATQLIDQLAGGKIASDIQDEHDDLPKPPMVRVHASFVNERLGLDLSVDDMQKLLENVEMQVERTDNTEELKVTAPYWRTDLEIPEDIVEEIGRLYGFDRLPLELPGRDLSPTKLDNVLAFKQQIREILAKGGANEVLTYSFVHGNLLEKVGQDPQKAFKLTNALSPDLQYFRMTLLPSLLDKVHPNIKAGFDEFAIFELNRGHNRTLGNEEGESVPKEFNFLSLVYAANDKVKQTGAAFYQARKYLDFLAAELGVELQYTPAEDLGYAIFKPFDLSRTAAVTIKENGTFIGVVGEFKPSVRKALKLPQRSAGFEVGTLQLMEQAGGLSYQPLPRFPKVSQDITLKVPIDLPYQTLRDFIWDNLDCPTHTLAHLEPIDIYQGDDKTTKNVTFRFTIASYERTLTDTEVSKLLDSVARKASAKLSAQRL